MNLKTVIIVKIVANYLQMSLKKYSLSQPFTFQFHIVCQKNNTNKFSFISAWPFLKLPHLSNHTYLVNALSFVVQKPFQVTYWKYLHRLMQSLHAAKCLY